MQHLTEQQISDYCEQQLSVNDLLIVSTHLQVCALCCERLTVVLQANKGRNKVGDVATAISPTLSADVFAHLSDEQLSAVVNQPLDAVLDPLLNRHLQLCRACQSDIEDLRQFKELLAQEPPKVLRAAVASAAGNHSWWRGNPRNVILCGVALSAVACLSYWWLKPVPKPLFTPIAQDKTPHPSLAASAPTAVESEKMLSASPAVIPLRSEKMLSASPAVIPLRPAQANLFPAEKTIQQVVAKGTLIFPTQLKKLRPGSANLMSSTAAVDTFKLLSPLGTFVEAVNPILRWASFGQAKSYTVVIADEDFNEIARSQPLTTTQWQVPISLARGKSYLWQVVATTTDGKEIIAPLPNTPEAKFALLTSAALSEIQQGRKRYANSPLELGILYAQYGLLAEAEHSLQQAATHSALARKLLRELQTKKD